MTKLEQLTQRLDELYGYKYWNKHGYITGLGRNFPKPKHSHLYRGDFPNPGNPLCRYGYNRYEGTGFSIWRNNVGIDGNCMYCVKKARKEIENKRKQ